MYIDHINANDNHQDAACVLSLMEAILNTVKQCLPGIEKVKFQSDNARTYSNALLPYFIPKLSESTGLHVKSFIHTETGQGKGLIDAHFATSMKKIHAYVDSGFNVCTPSQLIAALNYNGANHNCISEIIKHNKEHIYELEKKHKNDLAKLKKMSGRVNEIKFAEDNSYIELWLFSNIGSCKNYYFENERNNDLDILNNNSNTDNIDDLEEISIEDNGSIGEDNNNIFDDEIEIENNEEFCADETRTG